MNRKASSVAKGIAILMMLMHHLFYSAERIAANGHGQVVAFDPFTMTQVVAFSKSLKICVAVFVFITAYGTFMQLSKRLDAAPRTVPDAVGKISSEYALEHVVKLLINYWAVFVPFVILGCLISDHTVVSVYGGHGLVKAAFFFLVDFLGMANMLGTPTFNATWWYMSLALLLIVVMPALVLISRKIGSFNLLGIIVAFPLLAGFDTTSVFWTYAPTVALGIMCAQYDLFSKMDFGLADGGKVKRVLLLIGYLCLLVALVYLRRKLGFIYLFNAACALTVCQVARIIEPVSVVLDFFGKHSMNMFFMHSFIYSEYFGELVFSAHWFGLIFVVLAVSSVLCSIVIELGKKYLRINAVRDRAVGAVRAMKVFAVE